MRTETQLTGSCALIVQRQIDSKWKKEEVAAAISIFCKLTGGGSSWLPIIGRASSWSFAYASGGGMFILADVDCGIDGIDGMGGGGMAVRIC